MSIEDIQKLTREYADKRAVLSERVDRLNQIVERAKRRYLPGIKSAVANAMDAKSVLHAEIDQSRDLFVRPRTQTFHGIKVGIRNSDGTVVFGSGVVDLIKRHLPDMLDDLIKTEEKPVKGAVKGLTPQQLRKIGATIKGAGDHVLIKPTDSSVDKLVDALLKEDDDQE